MGTHSKWETMPGNQDWRDTVIWEDTTRGAGMGHSAGLGDTAGVESVLLSDSDSVISCWGSREWGTLPEWGTLAR